MRRCRFAPTRTREVEAVDWIDREANRSHLPIAPISGSPAPEAPDDLRLQLISRVPAIGLAPAEKGVVDFPVR